MTYPVTFCLPPCMWQVWRTAYEPMTDPFFRRSLVQLLSAGMLTCVSAAMRGTVRIIRAERKLAKCWPPQHRSAHGQVHRFPVYYTGPMARRHRSQCCTELLVRVSVSICHTSMIAVVLRGRAHVEPIRPVHSIIFTPQASISANAYGEIQPRPARRGLR
jgi:hypothetical protein